MTEAMVAKTGKSLTRCASCPIRERAICAYCGPQELVELDAIKSYRTYPKGSEIVAEGEKPPFVASIVNGVVSLSKTLMDGRRQMVGLQFPSDFVGGAFRDSAPCDATAASEVLLCQFERTAFEALMRTTPALKERLLDLTLHELDAAQDWLTLLGQKTAREKVASFLLMIAKRVGRPEKSGPVTAELPITRAEIGQHIGLTIETVSRQLSKLKSSGVIDFETTRRFHVPDMAALAAEAGERVQDR
ncbi:MAG: Crp/Fnr family transcriptional regulator [Neomegalonema sp.]|nr:Crp/Fnr family transcriptional regulator [Neomegalonema sp.]